MDGTSTPRFQPSKQPTPVESALLDDEMKRHLENAMKSGCTPEGHRDLVEYLVMAHSLHVETRNSVRTSASQMVKLCQDMAFIRKAAEQKSALFAQYRWGNPVKIGALGTALVGAVSYLIDKLLGLFPHGNP